MNIRAFIQKKKEQFRTAKIEKIKTQTEILAKEAKARKELAASQQELIKYKKIEESYKKTNPGILRRFGSGLKKFKTDQIKRSAVIEKRNARLFGGSGDTGDSQPSFLKMGKSPFAEASKHKFKPL